MSNLYTTDYCFFSRKKQDVERFREFMNSFDDLDYLNSDEITERLDISKNDMPYSCSVIDTDFEISEKISDENEKLYYLKLRTSTKHDSYIEIWDTILNALFDKSDICINFAYYTEGLNDRIFEKEDDYGCFFPFNFRISEVIYNKNDRNGIQNELKQEEIYCNTFEETVRTVNSRLKEKGSTEFIDEHILDDDRYIYQKEFKLNVFTDRTVHDNKNSVEIQINRIV